MQVQTPPFRQIGVFDVDTFFPEKDRFGLAMRLNSIIASPACGVDAGRAAGYRRTTPHPGGRPRHSIFYIAHLSEAERMFFVTLLLEQVVSWKHAETGTTSLQRTPLHRRSLRLLPAREHAPVQEAVDDAAQTGARVRRRRRVDTQNPVDLDYKGLTNAGTWFVGKLQTDATRRG